MATPESLVYNRVEGSGAAQIFGREGNPMRAVLARKADEERKNAVKAAQVAEAKKARDKKMMELIMVDPEKTFQPFNEQILKAAEAHRNNIVGYFEKGGNPDDPKFLSKVKQGWNQVNDQARRGLYIQDEIKKTMEQIKQNPYLITDYYFPKIFDQYMDENGNGKPLDQIDIAKIQNIYVEDPRGYDIQKYTKDFMSKIDENVFNWVDQKYNSQGLQIDDIQTKIKGELYTPDQNTKSGVAEDENGNPIINATNDFINAFTGNETVARFIDNQVKNSGRSRKEIIESLVKPHKGFAHDVKTSLSRNPEWYYDNIRAARGGIKSEDIPDATYRYDKTVGLINAFYNEDGTRRLEASPDAKAALGHLKKNVKAGGGDIIDAELVPGTNSPEANSVLGMSIQSSPNDRIIFKVKYGDRGTPKPLEINLNDEGSLAEINSLFEAAKSEGGKHFGVDQLLQLKGKSLSDLYGNRAGLTTKNEANKRSLMETTHKILASPYNAEIDDLKGLVYNGKKIKSGRRIQGAFNWGAERDDYLEVEFEDGTDGEIPAKKSDAELIRKMVSGEYLPGTKAAELKGTVR